PDAQRGQLRLHSRHPQDGSSPGAPRRRHRHAVVVRGLSAARGSPLRTRARVRDRQADHQARLHPPRLPALRVLRLPVPRLPRLGQSRRGRANMSIAADRAREYDRLHRETDLRFPLEDYPAFCAWLNVPRQGAGLRLLDIACGQGFFLDAASRALPALELHAIDFSEVAVERAAARARTATVRQAMATALPFDDSSFDYC